MGVTNEQMQNILGRARLLCTENADRKMDQMKGGKLNNDPDPADFDGEEFDKMYLSESLPTETNIDYYGEGSSSKMPSFIKESMIKNRIDPHQSVLDKIDTSKITPNKNTRGSISENATRKIQESVLSNAIDYSVIRAIVNECIDTKLKEYFGNKGQINESAGLKTVNITNGNINLIDNSGRVFSAELKYTGKVKKKS